MSQSFIFKKYILYGKLVFQKFLIIKSKSGIVIFQKF